MLNVAIFSDSNVILMNQTDLDKTKSIRSSYKERRENDLASGADEGRDKLR